MHTRKQLRAWSLEDSRCPAQTVRKPSEPSSLYTRRKERKACSCRVERKLVVSFPVNIACERDPGRKERRSLWCVPRRFWGMIQAERSTKSLSHRFAPSRHQEEGKDHTVNVVRWKLAECPARWKRRSSAEALHVDPLRDKEQGEGVPTSCVGRELRKTETRSSVPRRRCRSCPARGKKLMEPRGAAP